MLDIKKLIAKMLSEQQPLYPVGFYLHTSDGAFNPNTDIGGTWELLGEGKVLLSGSKDGTYKVGNQYGSNTHTLKTDEMPAHTHGSKSLTGMVACQSYSNGKPSGIVSTIYTNFNLKATSGANNFGTHNQNINASHEHSSVGGGKPHNIMQLSEAVYIWHRIA